MRQSRLLEVLVPAATHALLTTATIVLAAEVLKKVNRMHKDIKLLGEKHGMLKLAVKVLAEKEKRDAKKAEKEAKKAEKEEVKDEKKEKKLLKFEKKLN